MAEAGKTVCVTGASGYIGSWLTKRLLERGYTVRATVQESELEDAEKVKHLLELPNAETQLSLWKADLLVAGSFDEAIQGCNGVFHLATPMNFDSPDPENEVIKPTVDGVVDVLKSCMKAETVRRVVFTSSAGAVDQEEHSRSVYDETCWSDLDFVRAKKMTGWMYFVSKTLAERTAWEFAKKNGIDLVTIMPTLVVGPFIVPSFPPSLITALSRITGNEGHYWIIKEGHFVHLDDLCNAHIFLYKHPKAEGRYICSSVDASIYDLADLLRQKYPGYNIPTKFKGVEDEVKNVTFCSKKLIDLGFEYKHSLDDMYTGALETCQAKGLLPS